MKQNNEEMPRKIKLWTWSDSFIIFLLIFLPIMGNNYADPAPYSALLVVVYVLMTLYFNLRKRMKQNNEEMPNLNCPHCEVRYEEKPQLTEIEAITLDKSFKCDKCKIRFELKEYEE